MAPSAWQVLCGLEAWLVTQIARRPQRREPGGAENEGDLLAGQRAAALGAAHHGGSGPVGFAWVRDRPSAPVQVVAAGRALAAAAADRSVALKLPAGGRGEALGPGSVCLAGARGAGEPCRARGSGVRGVRGAGGGAAVRQSAGAAERAAAALARPPAREIPGSARFVRRPEFDTIPEPATAMTEPGAEVIRIRPGEAGQAAAGINPLEPAAWTDGARFPLQTHADLVKSLFLAAFEADEPFPQVLNAALTRVYDEHGWDLVRLRQRHERNGPPHRRHLTVLEEAHRLLPAADDRAAVGATMNLTPAQEQYIVTLSPGEAAVFADGADYPWLVRMPDGQRDQAQLRAVIWGQRPAPALERAAGATAGDQDWTERVASLLDVFAAPSRWPLDYLTPPGQAS